MPQSNATPLTKQSSPLAKKEPSKSSTKKPFSPLEESQGLAMAALGQKWARKQSFRSLPARLILYSVIGLVVGLLIASLAAIPLGYVLVIAAQFVAIKLSMDFDSRNKTQEDIPLRFMEEYHQKWANKGILAQSLVPIIGHKKQFNAFLEERKKRLPEQGPLVPEHWIWEHCRDIMSPQEAKALAAEIRALPEYSADKKKSEDPPAPVDQKPINTADAERVAYISSLKP